MADINEMARLASTMETERTRLVDAMTQADRGAPAHEPARRGEAAAAGALAGAAGARTGGRPPNSSERAGAVSTELIRNRWRPKSSAPCARGAKEQARVAAEAEREASAGAGGGRAGARAGPTTQLEMARSDAIRRNPLSSPLQKKKKKQVALPVHGQDRGALTARRTRPAGS